MRALFALLLFGCLGSPVRADSLDSFCKTARLSSSIAICSDPELRALDIERQQAYNQTKALLDISGRRRLLADQNGWVESYPLACGLRPRVSPRLPLAPAIKQCMANAGRARIAYLRAYAGVSPTNDAPPTVASRGAVSARPVPQFVEFPSAVYRGPVGRLDLSSPNAYAYRTRLRNGAKQPVNFAGHYQLVQWGCGTDCLTGAIIDALTGQVTFLPGTFTSRMAPGEDGAFMSVEFRLKSRLIVFSRQFGESGGLGTYFDLWTGSDFQNLLIVPFVPRSTVKQAPQQQSNVAAAPVVQPAAGSGSVPNSAPPKADSASLGCWSITDSMQRLACYDSRVGSQQTGVTVPPGVAPTSATRAPQQPSVAAAPATLSVRMKRDPSATPNIEAVGPWRTTTMLDKFDNVKILLTTNVVDEEMGTFTFGFRCAHGKYTTFLTLKKSKPLFTKGSIYKIYYKLNDRIKRSATAFAVTPSALFFNSQIPLESLYSQSEILFRVTADDGSDYDSSFPLDQAKEALSDMASNCKPDN